MAEVRDPAIKLFGRRIPVVEAETGSDDKDIRDEATCTEVNASTSTPEELDQGKPGSKVNEDNNQISNQNDKATVDQKSNQVQTETEADASDQGKVLKKPDKILPCPRCNSMDTKFCYYNNYNVNQPRHFCKNCQRYWTAGGTMRNVPVGAGRRKNKHSSSHLRQLDSTSHLRQLAMPSDGLVANRADAPDSSHQTLPCISIPTGPLKGNGTVLKFGPEAPLCESMASVLNLQEHNRNSAFNPISCGDNREEPSCGSSNCAENGFPNGTVRIEPNHTQVYCNEATPMQPMQCYPGNPWPYPWGPSWNNVAAAAVMSSQCSEFAYGQENGRPSTIPWSGLPPNMAAAAFYGPAIPIPFMPASFWGCMPGWTSGTWNVPWVGPNCVPSSTSSTGNASSGCGSPTLGKHSRDASSQAEEKTEKSLWVPKTLRIDDPDEAAKSSIWATLGINPNEGGIFKDFRSKSQVKGQSSDTTQVLHANPAALSRFQSFQEST